jgi:hypothetical protein
MEPQAAYMSRFVLLLEALDATAREQVTHINADRIWFGI